MKELYIAAHPDDETLGCGGTIAKHVAAGAEASWVIVTQAHEPQWAKDVIERKAAEVEQVARAYGFARTFRLGLPTTRLDTVPRAQLMDGLREAIESVRPHTVYVTHPGDVHSDHRNVFEATIAVLRAFRLPELGIRRILCYETLSSTDAAAPQREHPFSPAVFVDIAATIDRKLDVMALYESEAQPDPLPRGPSAIRALARSRGATVGLEYAEAFEVVRELAE